MRDQIPDADASPAGLPEEENPTTCWAVIQRSLYTTNHFQLSLKLNVKAVVYTERSETSSLRT